MVITGNLRSIRFEWLPWFWVHLLKKKFIWNNKQRIVYSSSSKLRTLLMIGGQYQLQTILYADLSQYHQHHNELRNPMGLIMYSVTIKKMTLFDQNQEERQFWIFPLDGISLCKPGCGWWWRNYKPSKTGTYGKLRYWGFLWYI